MLSEGAWVQVDSTLYTQLRKGTVGYVEVISIDHVSVRPTYHPDGKIVNRNNKWISKKDVKVLDIQLSEKELDDLIDLALMDKDEQTFSELWNRRY